MVETRDVQELPLWAEMRARQAPVSFDLELTARCNNDCRHCYINLPAEDDSARAKELSVEEIGALADEAVFLGVVWCLLTGGEPLLRDDFTDIYLLLKRKGLLVSVFTNATLISDDHVRLFKAYPPRDIEVTVYGVAQEPYERVSRRPGSFAAFHSGLGRLLENGIGVRLKAMAIRSNFEGLDDVFRFCHERTKDYFRFDPFLHLRFDGNAERNREIVSERLEAEDIVALERSQVDRFRALQGVCDAALVSGETHDECDHLFHCGAGDGSFTVSCDGLFRLCSSLWHHECVYDLRRGSLTEAYRELVPRVRGMRSKRRQFLETCRVCPITNLCMWCPANAHLETGGLDAPVEYFCKVAHARARSLAGGSSRDSLAR